MAATERLFLLDGMALAYRSYFAFIKSPLTNAKGENTSAVYGFVTFLNKILSQEFPQHLAVVFDTAAPTFRHKAYKEYKATREKMPDDMAAQLPVLKEVIRAYNIPIVEVEGYEADDIIGTLAKQAEQEGAISFLVTPDKDFLQLVSEQTKIFKPGRQGTDVEIIDIEGVKKRFGVAPEHVIDVLALMGDSSDNIPGVPGIGEKTAIPLIQKYGSVENLYQHLEEIPQKGVRTKLETNKELAKLSKELVTICTTVPLKINFHNLKTEKKDTAKLIQLFEELSFRSLVERLRLESGTASDIEMPDADIEFTPPEELSNIANDEHIYTLITKEKDFRVMCKQLASTDEFVYDTETSSVDALQAELVGMSFALKPHEAWYVAIRQLITETPATLFSDKPQATSSDGISLEDAVKALKPIFENPKIKKIGHNIKYDMLVLSQYGIHVQGVSFDSMVASYVVRADGRHGMDDVAEEYLHYKPVSFNDLVGTGKNQKGIREIPLANVSNYSCEDADITFRLYRHFEQAVAALGMINLCKEIEFPLVSVLAHMEQTGIAIDSGYLIEMSKGLTEQIDTLTRDIFNDAGGSFNINSTQQLGEILFNRLKLPTARKTKTGFSTDIAVLESLQGTHPIIARLLDFRQLTKLKSTYVDALPKLVNPKTGRVHTSFNQTVATTGRLSSSNPNLQNIPIRTDIGRSIRKAFIPGSNNSLILSADYSQIELRVMAHVANDTGLIEAFRNNEDIHATTAAKVFGVSPADVTRDMRRKAKEVNFGIMYGIGPFGLASRLEISQTEAKEIIARYFERFPKVQQYIHDTIESARTNGYVSTLLGRRRYFADITSKNQTVRQNAERQAINMPIQGTAADMIKLAMVHLDAALQEQKLQSAMVIQVHDELVFEIPAHEEATMRMLVHEKMCNALPLSVPIEIEIGTGKNWLEAH